MAEDLELLRLRAKAKLKLRQRQQAAPQAPAPEPQAPPQEEPGMGMQALDYGMRALDYAGGLGRTAAMGYVDLARAVQGKPAVSRPDALKQALMGKAPGMAEQLERGGVGEMGKVRIPMTDIDVTGRGALGFAGDVALDPLTYATGGVSAVTKAKKALAPLNVVGKGTEKLGEMVYRSGLKNVDKTVREYGKVDLSKVLLKEGAPSGSIKQIQDFTTQRLMPKYDAQRKALYETIDSAGTKVDPSFAKDEAVDVLNRMRQDPGLRDKANKLQEFVDKYTGEGPVTVQQMSDWKTNLYDSLPDAAFKVTESGGRQLSNWGKKVEKALSKGFKKEIENAGEFVQKGLGKKISNINEKWGTVIQSQKPLAREVKKAETINKWTSVDAMLAGGGALYGDPLKAMGLLGLKKGTDIAKTTTARTGVGTVLRSAGQSGLVDPIVRRAGIGAWQNVQDR